MNDQPKFNLNQFIAQNLSVRSIFAFVVIIVCCQNFSLLTKKVSKVEKKHKNTPYTFLGTRFSGLDQFLKEAERIGYITDKDLDDTISAAQYAQAQYTMAPIILDLNNTNYDYAIFDCTSETMNYIKIKELGFTAFKRNQFGIILAKKRK